MSRVATLEIIWQTDLGSAKSKYDEFKRYVETNPPRISFTPTGDGSRVVPTFGGQSQTVVGPAPGQRLPLTSGSPGGGFITSSGGGLASAPGVVGLPGPFAFNAMTGGQQAGPLYAPAAPVIAQPTMAIPPMFAAGSPLAAAYAQHQFLNAPTTATMAGLLPPPAGGGVAPAAAAVAASAASRGNRSPFRTLLAAYGAVEVGRMGLSYANRSLQRVLAEEPIEAAEADIGFAEDVSSIPILGQLAALFTMPDRTGAMSSVTLAKRAQRSVRATTARMRTDRAMKRETAGLERSAFVMGITDDFSQERAGATAEFMGQRRELLDQERDLEQQYADAMSEGNSSAAYDKLRDLNQLRRNMPAKMMALGNVQGARITEINRQQMTAGVSAELSGIESEQALKGNAFGAAMAKIRNQFLKYVPIFDSDGNVTAFANVDEATASGKQLAQGLKRQYNAAVAAAVVDEAKDVIGRRSHISSLEAALSFNPIGARLAELRGERNVALEGLDPTTDRAKYINRVFEIQTDLEHRELRHQAASSLNRLLAERTSIEAALSRQPSEVGEAATIGATGLDRAAGLYRSNMQYEGRLAKENTLRMLDLTRQQYFDQFRGTQVDLNLIATQGGRQSEDPAAVSAAIEKAKNDLIEGFRRVMQEVVDAGP